MKIPDFKLYWRILEARSAFDETGLLPKTKETAKRLHHALPDDSRPPKVATDGDGGIYFAWEGKETLIVGVTGRNVYAVINAGTPQSKHIDERPFRESFLLEILNHIPRICKKDDQSSHI